MLVSQLITALQQCDPSKVVKIFNIERHMDILEVHPESTRLDTSSWEETPLHEVHFIIGLGEFNDVYKVLEPTECAASTATVTSP